MIVSLILIGIVFLSQSIRFLELIVETGASSGAFWILIFLALPRFFEVVIPIAVMISILFIYHRLMVDSELVVMKSAGLSSMQLARPALFFIACIIVFLYFMTFWAGPKSAASMQHYRQVVKASAAQLFFREGVFNTFGDGLMFYIRNKANDGTLHGLMIHDARGEGTKPPVTVLAEKGVITSDAGGGRQVVVFDGQRQQYNAETQILEKLAFDKYTIEIPEQNKEIRQRWAEPDERSFLELVFPPDADAEIYERVRKQFVAEANRRITVPLLTLAFGSVSLAFLLLGPVTRHGYARRIVAAALAGIFIQSFYLASFNFAQTSYAANVLLYLMVLGPIIFSYLYLKNYNRLFLRRTQNVMDGKEMSDD